MKTIILSLLITASANANTIRVITSKDIKQCVAGCKSWYSKVNYSDKKQGTKDKLACYKRCLNKDQSMYQTELTETEELFK